MSCPTAGDPSAGGARRNAKLTALRELVSQDRAVLAVDLASKKHAAVVCDHAWDRKCGLACGERAAGDPSRRAP